MAIDTKQFKQIVEGYEGNNPAIILLQNPPGPDAMSSSAGMKLLLEKVFNFEAKIYHFGEVSHPQNKHMKNALHIAMEDGSELDTEEVGPVIALDTDLVGTGFKRIKKIQQVDIRIDHHTTDRDNASYKDVRSTGACASTISSGVSCEASSGVNSGLGSGISSGGRPGGNFRNSSTGVSTTNYAVTK